MSVFLGECGRVSLERKAANTALYTTVNASDVRPSANRFSVDFAHEQIITGDRLEIRTTGDNDGDTINWIDDSTVDNSFTRYAHMDEAGGIRLYDTFEDALIGSPDNAISLKAPDAAQETKISIKDSSDDRCLAEVTEYQITTSRESINTTHLGSQFVKQYEAGLIQGQGTIQCFWKNKFNCGDEYGSDEESKEFSAYLAKLCLRLVHGAAFHGYFYIYADESLRTRSVWYESKSCVITNVALTVSPTQAVETTINFVTNGPISLREGYLPAFLELEQTTDNVGLEQGGGIELDNPDN